MKLHPRSSALFSAATDSSSRCVPQLPPMAHAPKPISETFQPRRPNVRYFMAANFDPIRRCPQQPLSFAAMDEIFSDRLLASIEAKGSPICVGIDPIFEMLPDEIAGDAKERDGNDSEAAIDAIFTFTTT